MKARNDRHAGTGVLEDDVAPVPSQRWTLQLRAGDIMLPGDLEIPEDAIGLVLFVHGSGSSRHSPRNQAVAETLRECGIATLLFDLLTSAEEQEDVYSGAFRFNIALLTRRLIAVTQQLVEDDRTRDFGVGYFGASTGGAAALLAAAELGSKVDAVVSRGGRPDLAGEVLARVQAPTLLIVGGADEEVLVLNQKAYAQIKCNASLAVVPHATHLFIEPGALEEVAHLAAEWFERHLKPRRP